MKLVADMSEIIAQRHPDNIVIRVIQVTANESWSDCVRSIATQDNNLPSNVCMYTTGAWAAREERSKMAASLTLLSSRTCPRW